jgi:Flp pilus assembly secretin CpaC
VNVTISPSIKTAGQAPGSAPPPITNRAITTNVMLMDGETIALGGLISSKEDNRREFVPVLGSIPLLGYIFSWRKALTITNELVIYVTPHILNPETQAVNLEEEFEALDRRSGFLKNSDFFKSKDAPAGKKEPAKAAEPEKGASQPVQAQSAPGLPAHPAVTAEQDAKGPGLTKPVPDTTGAKTGMQKPILPQAIPPGNDPSQPRRR